MAFEKHVYRSNKKFILKKGPFTMSLKCRNRSYPKNNNNNNNNNKLVDLLQCLESAAIGNYRKKKIRPPITALAKCHNRSWSNLDLLQRLESATIGTA